MKKNDVIFLAAALAAAATFAGLSVREYRSLGPASQAAGTAVTGAGGKARDLDLGKVRRQIREGRLSGHEALYYKKAEAAP